MVRAIGLQCMALRRAEVKVLIRHGKVSRKKYFGPFLVAIFLVLKQPKTDFENKILQKFFRLKDKFFCQILQQTF